MRRAAWSPLLPRNLSHSWHVLAKLKRFNKILLFRLSPAFTLLYRLFIERKPVTQI